MICDYSSKLNYATLDSNNSWVTPSYSRRGMALGMALGTSFKGRPFVDDSTEPSPSPARPNIVHGGVNVVHEGDNVIR